MWVLSHASPVATVPLCMSSASFGMMSEKSGSRAREVVRELRERDDVGAPRLRAGDVLVVHERVVPLHVAPPEETPV